jgi:hypothetical protein
MLARQFHWHLSLVTAFIGSSMGRSEMIGRIDKHHEWFRRTNSDYRSSVASIMNSPEEELSSWIAENTILVRCRLKAGNSRLSYFNTCVHGTGRGKPAGGNEVFGKRVVIRPTKILPHLLYLFVPCDHSSPSAIAQGFWREWLKPRIAHSRGREKLWKSCL